MNVKPEIAALFTLACAILHNIGIERDDINIEDTTGIDDIDMDNMDDGPVIDDDENNGDNIRNLICRNMYNS